MSGQQIGTVIGFAVGTAVGFPQVGALIGGYVGGVISPTVIKGPDIGDAATQGSTEGWSIVKNYGLPPFQSVCCIDGDPIARKIKIKQDAGKGSTTQTEQDGFIATRAYLIGEGSGDDEDPVRLVRMRRNGKLVLSYIAGDVLDPDSAAFASKIRFYAGTQDQLPDPSLEAINGVDETQSYPGHSYFVVIDDDETQSGGRPNVYEVQVSSCGTVTPGQGTGQWWMTVESTTTSRQNKLWTSDDALTYPNSTTRTPNINPLAGGTGGPLYAGDGQMIIYSESPEGTCEVEVITDPSTFPITTTIATVPDDFRGGKLGRFGDTLAAPVNGKAQCLFSVDKGANWSVKAGPDADDVIGLGRLSGGRWLCATGVTGPGGLYYSDVALPASTDWIPATGTVSGSFGLWTNGSIGIRFGNLGNVWRTADGAAWTSTAHGLGTVSPYTGIAFRDTFLIGESNTPAVLRSTDGGFTWTRITISGTAPGGIAKLDRDPISGTIVACTGGGFTGLTEVWVSNDDGASWTQATLPFTPSASDEIRVGFYPFYELIGMAIPDAPGYFVDNRGVISGPAGASVEPCSSTLKTIITDIFSRVPSFPLDRLSIDNMTDVVPGYRLARSDMSALVYAADVCAPYFYDLVSTDDHIIGVKRGGAIVATLTDADFAEVEPDEDETRNQQVEYPGLVTVFSPDPEENYVNTPQPAARESPNVAASSAIKVQSIIPLSKDFKAQLANALQKQAFAKAEGGLKRTLRRKWVHLKPADCFEYNSRRYIITKARRSKASLYIEADYDRVDSYDLIGTGVTGPTPQAPTSNLKGPTVFSALNLSSLRDADNSPGMYLFAMGLLPGWPGAYIYLSTNGGVSFTKVATLTVPSVMGELMAAIGTSTEPINVQVYGTGEMASVSDAEIAARANGFAIDSAGVPEVGQVKTVTDNGAGTYGLTDVTRGELYTTAAAHAAGDRFVMLDNAFHLDIALDYTDTDLIFKVVTIGTPYDMGPEYTVHYDMPEYIEDGGTPG